MTTYDQTGSLVINVTKGGQRTAQTAWANDMAIQSVTDLDNGITTSYGYDNAGRPISITEGITASTPSGMRQTLTTYDNANRKVAVAGDLNALGDGTLQTITHYDQLGRAVLGQQSDGSPLSNDPFCSSASQF